MRYLLLLLLLLPGLPAHANERLVRQFEALAFSADYPTIVKWRNDPVFLFMGDIDVAESHEADLIAAITAINEATGLGFHPATVAHDTTLAIGFFDRRDYKKTLSTLTDGAPLPVISDRFWCVATFMEPINGANLGAAALIDTTSRTDFRRHCIHHELLHAMGLTGHGCHAKSSALCLDATEATTDTDKLMLRVLYDPRLKPGMTKQEAMPLVRQIIGEIGARQQRGAASE